MVNLSDHFDGKKYFNPGLNVRGFKDIIKWLLTRRVKKWDYTTIEPKKVVHQRVPLGDLWITYINHATTLIQIDAQNILTDPVWSERASPFKKFGPKRVHAPGICLQDLPSIDFVLISHNHYDHLDIETLQELEKAHHPHFYTSQGNATFLKSIGLEKVQEFDWWDHVPLSANHTLHFVPAQHFSARGLFDRNKTLWGGFILKSPSKIVYFAGDTGYGAHFNEIQSRIGPPSLSLLPIGAFKPEWFMHPMHLSPSDAVQAHLDLKSKQSVAIHFDTFQLADEALKEAPTELRKELSRRQLSPHEFWVLEPGEGRQIV